MRMHLVLNRLTQTAYETRESLSYSNSRQDREMKKIYQNVCVKTLTCDFAICQHIVGVLGPVLRLSRQSMLGQGSLYASIDCMYIEDNESLLLLLLILLSA